MKENKLKIKNTVDSISPDISIILMCLGILIACPIRIFQMLKNIDPVTGFFDDYTNLTIFILYGIIGIAGFLIVILTFLSSKIPAAVAPQGRRIPLGLASAVFSVTLFFDAINNYLSDSQGTATIIQNAESVSNLHHVHAIFAFLSCCYFMILAFSYIAGRSFHKKLRILSLAPLFWAVICVLERITIIISIVRVSELLLEIIAFVCLMIFFLTFARVVSEVNCKGSMWSVIAFGSVASLVLLVFSIPRFIITLTGNADKLVSGYPFIPATLGCALFAIVFVITTLRCGYKVEDIEQLKKEEEEAVQTEETTEDAPADVPVMRDTSGNIRIAKVSSPVNTDAEDNSENAQEE